MMFDCGNEGGHTEPKQLHSHSTMVVGSTDPEITLRKSLLARHTPLMLVLALVLLLELLLTMLMVGTTVLGEYGGY